LGNVADSRSLALVTEQGKLKFDPEDRQGRDIRALPPFLPDALGVWSPPALDVGKCRGEDDLGFGVDMISLLLKRIVQDWIEQCNFDASIQPGDAFST
jgi:hypothetical protein